MSSVTVAGGRIFTLGKRAGKGVSLIALSAENGEEIWATPIEPDGDPNGSPTIDGDRVFAITYNGTLVCAETATGRIVWQKSLVDDFGGEVPNWGYSESPLVDGDDVVCTPGADDALIVALNKTTGETIWKTTAPPEMQDRGHDGAGYSSIVIGHGAGIRQYVQLVGNGVIGVSTHRRHAAVGLQPHRQRRGQHSHADRARRLRLHLHRLRRRLGAACGWKPRPPA